MTRPVVSILKIQELITFLEAMVMMQELYGQSRFIVPSWISVFRIRVFGCMKIQIHIFM